MVRTDWRKWSLSLSLLAQLSVEAEHPRGIQGDADAFTPPLREAPERACAAARRNGHSIFSSRAAFTGPNYAYSAKLPAIRSPEMAQNQGGGLRR